MCVPGTKTLKRVYNCNVIKAPDGRQVLFYSFVANNWTEECYRRDWDGDSSRLITFDSVGIWCWATKIQVSVPHIPKLSICSGKLRTGTRQPEQERLVDQRWWEDDSRQERTIGPIGATSRNVAPTTGRLIKFHFVIFWAAGASYFRDCCSSSANKGTRHANRSMSSFTVMP